MEISDETFEQEVVAAQASVVVEFWASWCPPCKMMAPMVQRIAEEYEGRVRVVTMNVDRNPTTAGRYAVQGVPTFLALSRAVEEKRLVGAQTENALRCLLDGLSGS